MQEPGNNFGKNPNIVGAITDSGTRVEGSDSVDRAVTAPADTQARVDTVTSRKVDRKKGGRKLTRGQKIGLWAAGAALVGGGASVPVVATVLSAGTTQEGSVPDMSDYEDPVAPVIPDFIEDRQDVDITNFDTYPRGDRLNYFQYKIADGAGQHESLLPERPKWTTPSIDMGDQQILDNYIYVTDEAAIQWKVDSTGEKIHDEEEGLKVLSGAFYEVGTGSVYTSNLYKDVRATIESLTGPAAISGNTLRANQEKSENQTLTTREGEELTYRDITVTGEDGRVGLMRFVYYEYEATAVPDQEEEASTAASTWLAYELVDSDINN